MVTTPRHVVLLLCFLALCFFARAQQPTPCVLYATTITNGRLQVICMPPSQLPGVELSANKGQPNGYAPLDATGKVPAANLPAILGAATEANCTNANPAGGDILLIIPLPGTGLCFQGALAAPGATITAQVLAIPGTVTKNMAAAIFTLPLLKITGHQ